MLGKLIVVAMLIAAVVSLVNARARWDRECASHIRATPAQEWRGGNAPKVRMPEGCH